MKNPTLRRLLPSIGANGAAAAIYRTMDVLGMFGPSAANASAPVLPHGSGEGGRVIIQGGWTFKLNKAADPVEGKIRETLGCTASPTVIGAKSGRTIRWNG